MSMPCPDQHRGAVGGTVGARARPEGGRHGAAFQRLKGEGMKPAEITEKLDISLRSYCRIVAGSLATR
jgi:hypothetical protein